jgi:hypothetical protein
MRTGVLVVASMVAGAGLLAALIAWRMCVAADKGELFA